MAANICTPVRSHMGMHRACDCCHMVLKTVTSLSSVDERSWLAPTWRAAIGPMVEQSTSSAAFRPGCLKPHHVSPKRLPKGAV